MRVALTRDKPQSSEKLGVQTSLNSSANQQNKLDKSNSHKAVKQPSPSAVDTASLLAKAFVLVRKDDAERVVDLFKVRVTHVCYQSRGAVIYVCAASFGSTAL